MKTYQQACEFVAVSKKDRLRYNTWPAFIILADIYGIEETQVAADIAAISDKIELEEKQARREKNRQENIARMQANLERKRNSQ